jgi:hypothetical protein
MLDTAVLGSVDVRPDDAAGTGLVSSVQFKLDQNNTTGLNRTHLQADTTIGVATIQTALHASASTAAHVCNNTM